MGSYSYLINRDRKIRIESHKLTASGDSANRIENQWDHCNFLNYCMDNNLLIECVHESFFDKHENYDNETGKSFYKDFDLIKNEDGEWMKIKPNA